MAADARRKITGFVKSGGEAVWPLSFTKMLGTCMQTSNLGLGRVCQMGAANGQSRNRTSNASTAGGGPEPIVCLISLGWGGST
jgi:hypothetical protein